MDSKRKKYLYSSPEGFELMSFDAPRVFSHPLSIVRVFRVPISWGLPTPKFDKIMFRHVTILDGEMSSQMPSHARDSSGKSALLVDCHESRRPHFRLSHSNFIIFTTLYILTLFSSFHLTILFTPCALIIYFLALLHSYPIFLSNVDSLQDEIWNENYSHWNIQKSFGFFLSSLWTRFNALLNGNKRKLCRVSFS